MADNVEPDAHSKFFYVMGFLTASFLFLLVAGFVAYKVGVSTITSRLKFSRSHEPRYRQVMQLPDDVLDDLTRQGAVIDNAGNPTKAAKHDTPITKPDQELGWVLRPRAQIAAVMLRSIRPYNWDPPVLYLDRKKSGNLSPLIKNYLAQQSRLSYQYSTDNDGHRTTIPTSAAPRKILVVGDSVAFGVGVNDDQTIASQLQKIVGKNYHIVNAGVGGYDGRQAFKAAKKLAAQDEYSCLIYIACQNDYMQKESGDQWVHEADQILTDMKSLSPRFGGNVIVLLHPHLQYCLYDFMLEEGWDKEKKENTDLLRREMPKTCARLKILYGDSTDIARDFQKQNRSIFAPFALYADEAHFSPLGNRLVAEKLRRDLQQLKLLGE